MSDIFISYKREDQAIARKLADALEGEGWSVWWDPKLRAGERFNDVIEKALKEAKCVIVLWSERSIQSDYVKDEATYALEKDKLVPVAIETVDLPFRFQGLHTLSLVGWDGSKDLSEFRRLVDDISAIQVLHRGNRFVAPSPTTEQELQRAEQEANRIADPLQRLRRQMLIARTPRELRETQYELDAYLAKSPHSPEARLLKDTMQAATRRAERMDERLSLGQRQAYKKSTFGWVLVLALVILAIIVYVRFLFGGV
jgi:hypothetical protein